MRLTEWRTGAPNREALSNRVLDVVVPVLEALGAESDPHCWVAWGDDPGIRYMIFAPSPAGLIACSVRLSLPGEGPRASGKVVRWHRVQLGELAVETVGGHRLVSFQVESQVLRGADAAADRIAAFGLALFAAVDGRPMPDLGARKRRRKRLPAKGAKASGAKGTSAAKPRAGTGRRVAPKTPATADSAAAESAAAESAAADSAASSASMPAGDGAAPTQGANAG
jgi:hypothetical protein